MCGQSLGPINASVSSDEKSVLSLMCVCVLTQACTLLHVYHRVVLPHSGVCSAKFVYPDLSHCPSNRKQSTEDCTLSLVLILPCL